MILRIHLVKIDFRGVFGQTFDFFPIFAIVWIMYSVKVTPRFGDLDVLGHVNSAVPVFWFDLGRNPLLKIFHPNLKLKRETFPLILAHTDFDFVDQLYFQYDVEIKTWISRIGASSFTVYQEAWQEKRLCVKGSAVMVHYDFNSEKTTPIPEDKKKLLAEHLLEPAGMS